jgi:hypothetical protein
MRAMRLNGCAVVVFSLALLLPAAAAVAQVPNTTFHITDQNDADTTCSLNQTGASNTGVAQTICRNGGNTVTISVATTHPESVKLQKATAQLEQGSAGNLPTVRVIGAGAQVFDVVLTCSAATFKSFVNNTSSSNSGAFQVTGGKCSGLSDTQAAYLNDTCAADTTNTTITLTLKGAVVDRFTIKGRGNSLP